MMYECHLSRDIFSYFVPITEQAVIENSELPFIMYNAI